MNTKYNRSYAVRQGGLMRCCLATLQEAAEAGTLPWQVGEAKLDCQFEEPGNAQMRLAADGVWEWNSPFTATEHKGNYT